MSAKMLCTSAHCCLRRLHVLPRGGGESFDYFLVFEAAENEELYYKKGGG